MSPINPIEVSHNLSERYSTYLQSLVQPSNEQLAAALEKAVRESVETGNGIIKGPYVEATPPFESGKSLRNLVEEGVLSSEFLELNSSNLPIDRPLYKHQEDAIRKATSGRNLIVATGTGSGKTESFLIPVIDYIMRQKQQGELSPGVRALILYPMNALANDQVGRIRDILGNYPDITFGRYTGETEYTIDSSVEDYKLAHGNEPLPNELIARDQMQDTPPHILLTNFAMLEYLLLRPADSEFFDGAHSGNWKFIISDEAHVYDGAYGTEVGMLLRKLRERVDPSGSIQTIGTTATIGDNDEQIENFATNFFSNEFKIVDADQESKNLVRPTRKKIESATWGPVPPSDWVDFYKGQDFLAASPDPSSHESFLTEKSVVSLRNALFDGPLTIRELAKKVFGDEDDSSLQAVIKVVEFGSQIKDPQGNSALSARFHLFARATEGVFTCLSENPHAYLARHEECEHCDSPVLELAGCRRCGAEHYIGELNGENIFTQPSVGAKKKYAYPATVAGDDENEDQDFFEEVSQPKRQEEIELLCRGCGKSNPKTAASCDNCNGNELIPVRYSETDSVCKVCGSSSRNTLRSLESGNNAAAGVLVTELYSSLPEFEDSSRKIMVFSDNRQQAAFFAPYLQESYSKLMWRKSIHEALTWTEYSLADGEKTKLFELTSALKQVAQKNGLAAYGDDGEPKAVASRNLYLEAVTTDSRLSLEGSGLVSFDIDLPEQEEAYVPLMSLGFNHTEARDLLSQLLQIIRKNGVLTAPSPYVDQASDFFAPRSGPITLRYDDRDARKKVSSWKPASRRNGVSDYLARVLTVLDRSDKLNEVLIGTFNLLTQNEAFKGILSNESVGNEAAKFQLDHNHLLISSVERRGFVFQCNLCRTISSSSVKEICPRYRCTGKLEKIVASDVDEKLPMRHYREVYRDPRIGPLRAEEHTAQLSTKAARKIQRQFIDGKVNILSSSTTFELGVDVGELETVFLRNVPPGVANYLQRAGRAGRRADSAALIVTYAQRKPHDMAKYSEPKSLVAGEMRAPIVKLDNHRIMERHAFSMIFSDYFKKAFSSELPKSGEFFSDEPGSHSNSIIRHLEDNDEILFSRYERLIPTSLSSSAKQLWSDSTKQFKSLVKDVQGLTSKELRELDELIAERASKEDFTGAGRLKKYRNTIRDRKLIDSLSTRNLIPKYGFPVDTVELMPSLGEKDGKDIKLDRDLAVAIFEYAPGKQVIANGNTWESVGIQRPRSKEKVLIRKRYMSCKDCEFYQEKPFTDNDDKYEFCANCGSGNIENYNYLIPELGFLARSTTSDFSNQKNKGGWNRRVHVAEKGQSLEIGGNLTPPGVKANLQTVASMVVINESGTKFCPSCGAAFDISVKTDGMNNHERPFHSVNKCDNPFFQITRLGHKYQTDIVELEINWSNISIDRELAQVSLANAVLQGASEGLQIAIDDLDVVILPKSPTALRIALVDAVPAGAGFAQMISENLKTVFRSALEKVDDCECGEETSCYQCLRTYGNQREHDELNRGYAKQVLKEILHV